MDFISCSGAGMRFAFGVVDVFLNKVFQSLSECPHLHQGTLYQSCAGKLYAATINYSLTIFSRSISKFYSLHIKVSLYFLFSTFRFTISALHFLIFFSQALHFSFVLLLQASIKNLINTFGINGALQQTTFQFLRELCCKA
jgi:hypothetical protein